MTSPQLPPIKPGVNSSETYFLASVAASLLAGAKEALTRAAEGPTELAPYYIAGASVAAVCLTVTGVVYARCRTARKAAQLEAVRPPVVPGAGFGALQGPAGPPGPPGPPGEAERPARYRAVRRGDRHVAH